MGDDRCCLAQGATRATLKLNNLTGLINVAAGDVLIFIEKINPQNVENTSKGAEHKRLIRRTATRFA